MDINSQTSNIWQNPWLLLPIGALLGWFVTRFMNMYARPNLVFRPSDDKDFISNGKSYKFLNLIVENKRQNLLKKFLFGNYNLNNARVWLRFKDYSSKVEFLKISARWASTREPIDPTGHVIISEILLPSRETIPPGEDAGVSVALKESGEKIFFAFNNDSYLHNWKNPDYELDENKYWVEVRLLADGEEYKHEFLLTNPSTSLRNFKLLKT